MFYSLDNHVMNSVLKNCKLSFCCIRDSIYYLNAILKVNGSPSYPWINILWFDGIVGWDLIISPQINHVQEWSTMRSCSLEIRYEIYFLRIESCIEQVKWIISLYHWIYFWILIPRVITTFQHGWFNAHEVIFRDNYLNIFLDLWTLTMNGCEIWVTKENWLEANSGKHFPNFSYLER